MSAKDEADEQDTRSESGELNGSEPESDGENASTGTSGICVSCRELEDDEGLSVKSFCSSRTDRRRRNDFRFDTVGWDDIPRLGVVIGMSSREGSGCGSQ